MTLGQVGGERVGWLDTARAYGILLVFYGHFVEVISESGNPATVTQQKLIYAFHMPLFILLSGYLAKTHLPGLWPFLRKQAATRLLPVLFFSFLMMPVSEALDSLMGHDGWPTGMKAGWIRDWNDLGERLVPPHGTHHQEVRARLWAGMSDSAQAVASRAAAADSLNNEDKELVARALNAQLDRRDLYTLEQFAGVKLPPRVREALETGAGDLDEGDPVRSHNLQLTWWTLFPEEDWWWEDQTYWDEWLRKAVWTLRGYPQFNWLTWFLVCLFTVELYHFAAVRFLTSNLRVALAIPLFSVAGWLATMDMGRRDDVWFARESVLLYALYLAGHLLCRTRAIERLRSPWQVALLLTAAGGVTLVTFGLNPGSPMYNPVVLVNLSQHGDVALFLLTALTGSVAITALARLSSGARLWRLVGRNTLALMALSTIYFRQVNYALADLLPIGQTHLELILWCTGVSLAQMASLAPLIWLLNRYVPQLIGRPRLAGPWLPRLVD